jgi:hypothetical protein
VPSILLIARTSIDNVNLVVINSLLIKEYIRQQQHLVLSLPDVIALVDINLDQHRNTPKDITMHVLVVTVFLTEDSPLLKSSVDSFVSASNPLHSVLFIFSA